MGERLLPKMNEGTTSLSETRRAIAFGATVNTSMQQLVLEQFTGSSPRIVPERRLLAEW